MAGAYSGSSPFDQSVEKTTPDRSGETDWAAVMDICDKAGQTTTGPKDCLTSIMKRLVHSSKNVKLHAVTLLDSCILNCGAAFHKEVATPEFVKQSRKFLSEAPPEVADKFKENLKKWVEGEFKSKDIIVNFYKDLRSEGAYFGMGSKSTTTLSSSSSSAPVASAGGGGDDDLAKALALSLKESQSKSQASSLYPSVQSLGTQSSSSQPAPTYTSRPAAAPVSQATEQQVRALYDFEAVEENELTFKTGELITVLDNSDPNWWKGTTWRGQGLFPVNFVTSDLTMETADENSQAKKSVQFNEEVTVEQFDPDSVKIDEAVIDQALDQIQNADPTGLTEDTAEMTHLEDECRVMGPLIDQELEQTDSKHNELMTLNKKLTDAFQLYTQLMKDAANIPQYQPTVGYMQPPVVGAQANTYMPPPQQPGVPEQPLYTYNAESQPQAAYYNPGAYTAPPLQGAQPQQPMQQAQPAPEPQQPQQQYNQAAAMTQYQMNSTGLNDLQYIPTATGGAMPGLPQQPMYNAGQASYH